MIRKQPNSAMVPGIGPISFDDLTERGAVAARGDEQHHKVLHRPASTTPPSSHSVPGR